MSLVMENDSRTARVSGPKAAPSVKPVKERPAVKPEAADKKPAEKKPAAKVFKKEDLPEGAVIVNPEKPKPKVYRRVPSKKLLTKLWSATIAGYVLGFAGIFCLFGFPVVSAVAGAVVCYLFSLSKNFFRRAEMKSGMICLPIVFLGMSSLVVGVFMTPIWFKVMATGMTGASGTGQYHGFFNVCSAYSKEAVDVMGKAFKTVIVPILPK